MNLDVTTEPTEGTALDCGHLESPHSTITRGWGKDPQTGKRYCYACCEDRDRAQMDRDGKTCAYLSEDGKRITGWPGYELLRVTREWVTSAGGFAGRTNITRVWAVDAHGVLWHGRGPGRGMYIRLTRSKDKRARTR